MRSCTWPDGIEESALRQKKIIQIIPVHTEFQRPTHRREIVTLVNSIYNDTGDIVAAHWDQTEIRKFDVFVGAGSRGAIIAVNKWIARGDKQSRDAAAWAKLPAFDHAKWYQEELERQEEERLQIYLGPEPKAKEGEPILLKVSLSIHLTFVATNNIQVRSVAVGQTSSQTTRLAPELPLVTSCKPSTISGRNMRSGSPCYRTTRSRSAASALSTAKQQKSATGPWSREFALRDVVSNKRQI